ncbi:ATP-binding protein [Shewanella surugensis]|uniref:ATP-binding protein n=1 Tax=Shewanella surugensis TaxID=212020 RepID=A0ABT0LBB4_9GAMM|nr:ATP-binding protein [Shewanella surugensis]MCL1124964.1 ATP-binding protein [Shewanella surugensis]
MDPESDALSLMRSNIHDLEKEMAWCEQIIDTRLKLHFKQDTNISSIFDILPPDLQQSHSHYAQFIVKHQLDFQMRLILVLALLPALKPNVLDVLNCHNELTQRPFTEFAGVEMESCFYVTGETVSFLLGGDDLSIRFQVQSQLQSTDPQGLNEILYLHSPHYDPLSMKTPLRLQTEYLLFFTTSEHYRPDLSDAFPATRVQSQLNWQDLVLPKSVMEPLEEIKSWIQYGETLMFDWGFMNKLRPGYRALFYGPPGTGKTMTASVLGKAISHQVYHVDLSKIISKYIGETEKNLERVFSTAENKQWILFFDEADALFGKRTQASGINEQFANQNVAYLLQRIESFSGISILATNLKDNLDDAFFRRFESVIYFPLPSVNERLTLWRQGFSKKSTLHQSINLDMIAAEHVLSGAEIMNVIRFASLQALRLGTDEISQASLLEGIRRQKIPNLNQKDAVTDSSADIFG